MEGRPAGIQIIAPQRVQQAEILVMGVEVRTTYQQEMNPATAEIPKLWQRFLAEQLWLAIPESIHPQVFYGVYTDYEGDPIREYSLIVAGEVSSIDNPPENMVGVAIPARDYLVFHSINTSLQGVQQLWQQIDDYFVCTNTPYRRAFTTDFERYEEQQVSIHIAIR